MKKGAPVININLVALAVLIGVMVIFLAALGISSTGAPLQVGVGHAYPVCLPDSCNDSDGGIYSYVQGIVRGVEDDRRFRFTDSCLTNNTVKEYFCDFDETNSPYPDSRAVTCLYMCENGVCIPFCGNGVCEPGETPQNCPADCGLPDHCGETDGGFVVTVRGSVSGMYNGAPYNYTDFCINNTDVLMEYACSGSHMYSDEFDCEGNLTNFTMQCINGACRGDTECSDGVDNDGDGDIDYPLDSGCDNYDDTDETDCGDGVCEGGETNETCWDDCGWPPNSCTDTDGGFVLDVQGTVFGMSFGVPYNYTDFCTGNNSVNEYYCSGRLPAEGIGDCFSNQTCIDGACVQL